MPINLTDKKILQCVPIHNLVKVQVKLKLCNIKLQNKKVVQSESCWDEIYVDKCEMKYRERWDEI